VCCGTGQQEPGRSMQWEGNPGSETGTNCVADDPKPEGVTDEGAVEVSQPAPVTVRETRRLYRLRAERVVAVVAADTEDEARTLAAGYGLPGGDWRNPAFASAEVEETAETHVFGDVVISSLPGAPGSPKRK
jgi:hypothetical protein